MAKETSNPELLHRLETDSPDLVIAMRLLDHLKLRGFQFRRSAPGADAPLVGHRATGDWMDTIGIVGFSLIPQPFDVMVECSPDLAVLR